MTKLEQLTKRIQELVPEVKNRSWTTCKYIKEDNFHIYFYHINLADVLSCSRYKLRATHNGNIMLEYFNQDNEWEVGPDWSYSKPLHFQNEETINFLHELLCK